MTLPSEQYVLFWHRRDLRIEDNAGLWKALKSGYLVQPIFIFDTTILHTLNSDDRRVQFIYQEIVNLKHQYASLGTDLIVYFSTPQTVLSQLSTDKNLVGVYFNRDYEPYALNRDSIVVDLLKNAGISCVGSKDHVVFEKNEVTKDDGKPYTVFTPFSRKWKQKLTPYHLKEYPVHSYFDSFLKCNSSPLISLEEMGFKTQTNFNFPSKVVSVEQVMNYHLTRDIPRLDGTTRLSVHLRFGTISIRQLAKHAMQHNEVFLNELIWREFYQQILYHFPHTVDKAFKPQYDFIEWENNETHFEAWCNGKTGYPFVDAGMRELNETGFMHNRARMVTASFLTKHLLIDWRWGERYFAEKLIDFDLASNVGGWQWAASSGCDAAPYFRVFNPSAQAEKFDKDLSYIKKWIPEFGTSAYQKPIIEHKFARERVLERYKKGLTL
jgi:deoxyribodipyrimidine photo-lyase